MRVAGGRDVELAVSGRAVGVEGRGVVFWILVLEGFFARVKSRGFGYRGHSFARKVGRL